MKLLLVLLINFFKYAKLTKIFIPALSIILSIATYASFYGWKYAVGFVGLILIHEAGHYFAAQEKKLNVGLPMFIPFVGAWIELKEQPVNVETEAYVAYAGPFVGTIASFLLYYLGRDSGSGLLLALAQAGFLINLFNLIPLSPLDGGRITAIISPYLWFLGVPILIGIWFYHPSPMLVMIAILAIPQLIQAWAMKANQTENYYQVDTSLKVEYAIMYIGLAVVLALMVGTK